MYVVHNSCVLLKELFNGYYNVRNISAIVPHNWMNTYFCVYCFGTQGPGINNFQELCSSMGCMLQQCGVVHKDQITSVGRCLSNLSEACPQNASPPSTGQLGKVYSETLLGTLAFCHYHRCATPCMEQGAGFKPMVMPHCSAHNSSSNSPPTWATASPVVIISVPSQLHQYWSSTSKGESCYLLLLLALENL